MVLDIYRDCFSRIYIASPSINVDSTWIPVKEYIEKQMKVKSDQEDPTYFDHYDPADLIKIIATPHKVTDYMKKQNYKKLYQILVIVDAFAGEASFSGFTCVIYER